MGTGRHTGANVGVEGDGGWPVGHYVLAGALIPVCLEERAHGLCGSGPTSTGDWVAAGPRHVTMSVGVGWLLMLKNNCNNLRRRITLPLMTTQRAIAEAKSM